VKNFPENLMMIIIDKFEKKEIKIKTKYKISEVARDFVSTGKKSLKYKNFQDAKRLFLNAAYCYFILEHYNIAKTFFRKTYEISEQREDSLYQIIALNNLGMTFQYLGKFKKSLKKFKKALKILKDGNKKNQAIILNNIGGVFNNFGYTIQALDYYMKGIRICNNIGDWKIGVMIFINIIAIFKEL